jgi:chromosome segregation protein
MGNVARLNQKIRSNWNVHSLLAGIFCADDPEQAKLLAGRLGAGESVITPNGLWLGAGWISLNRTTDQHSGVLAREKELRELRTQLAELISMDHDSGLAREKLDMEAIEYDQLIDEIQSSERQLRQKLGENNVSLSQKKARHEYVNQRCGQIEDELADVGKMMEQNESLIVELAGKQKTAENTIRSLAEEKADLECVGHQLHNFKAEILRNAAAMHDKANRLEAGLEALRSSEQLASRHLQRLGEKHQQAIERGVELEKKLSGSTNPLQGYSEERDQLLGRKSELESGLKEARGQLIDCEKQSEQFAEQHARHQQNLGIQRDQLEQVRLAGQENRARSQAVIEQLDEFNIDEESIGALLPQQANEETWRKKVDKADDKIRRLGAINLAAIGEFEEQSERVDYLSEQHDDLLESLETLEQAMSKIDQESKTRFRNTFNQINEQLQRKFPKLFGGGHACLELTDTNLLETGVNIIARPPGKRNTSIHLLSGGEKALTAVALVFSIFELNPAPFCILDEVDAPLDDANVNRFSKLIEEMSERIQFIFITHNKVTMEAARHLTGVTMNEPGVSRMVVVDIDEAVEMAVQ